MSYRTITVRKDPAAPPITGLADYDALCGSKEPGEAGIGPAELRDLLDSGAAVVLIDVREPAEWEINHIDGAQLIPSSVLHAGLLPAGRIPVLYCKTGVRSAQAVESLKRAGVPDVRHLRGGIVAWAQHFDPDMAMY
jgi:adenylyltransferase/sulfurtransferase